MHIMSTTIDKALILKRIKKHFELTNDAELARFFDIAPTTISSWNARDTLNWDIIFAKCVDIDLNILIRGTAIEKQITAIESDIKMYTPAHDLLHIIMQKDQRLEELAEKNGELKYENKLLRMQLGRNNDNFTTETPKE